MRWRRLLLAVVFSAIVGCGGGGGAGSGSAGGSASNNPASGSGGGSGSKAPATQLRYYQPGDTWTYSVTGTETGQSGLVVAVNGTSTVAITRQQLSGVWCLAVSYTNSLTDALGDNLGNSSVQFVVQNPGTDDVAEIADASTLASGVVTPTANGARPVVTPGAWSSSTSLTSTAIFADGTIDTVALSVTGEQQVTTPAGAFATWTARSSDTISAGGASAEVDRTQAWAPEIGQPVQYTTKQPFPGGVLITTTSTLASYHLAPAPPPATGPDNPPPPP